MRRLKAYYPDFDFELVAWAEFDPETPETPLEKQPAVIAHNALFPESEGKNYGDITRINWHEFPDCDLLFYSTPCQSVSQAGLQHGFSEGSGTRSSIIWNVRDAIIAKKPKFLCLENVRAMVSAKFIDVFNLWQRELERLGYTQYAEVLDSRDFGVPQHRERIFLVSVRNNLGLRFHFPTPFKLKKCLKDVLEENVDEKFFLRDEMLARFCEKSLEEEIAPSIHLEDLENSEDENDLQFFVCQY